MKEILAGNGMAWAYRSPWPGAERRGEDSERVEDADYDSS